MTKPSPNPRLPKTMAARFALAITVAWGPGIAVALIVYFLTHRVPYSLLALAIATALTSLILGATAAIVTKRRADTGQ